MKLEEKLISLRKANGLSQFNLAEQLGVSRQAVPSRFMRKIICRLRLNEVSRQ